MNENKQSHIFKEINILISVLIFVNFKDKMIYINTIFEVQKNN